MYTAAEYDKQLRERFLAHYTNWESHDHAWIANNSGIIADALDTYRKLQGLSDAEKVDILYRGALPDPEPRDGYDTGFFQSIIQNTIKGRYQYWNIPRHEGELPEMSHSQMLSRAQKQLEQDWRRLQPFFQGMDKQQLILHAEEVHLMREISNRAGSVMAMMDLSTKDYRTLLCLDDLLSAMYSTCNNGHRPPRKVLTEPPELIEAYAPFLDSVRKQVDETAALSDLRLMRSYVDHPHNPLFLNQIEKRDFFNTYGTTHDMRRHLDDLRTEALNDVFQRRLDALYRSYDQRWHTMSAEDVLRQVREISCIKDIYDKMSGSEYLMEDLEVLVTLPDPLAVLGKTWDEYSSPDIDTGIDNVIKEASMCKQPDATSPYYLPPDWTPEDAPQGPEQQGLGMQ